MAIRGSSKLPNFLITLESEPFSMYLIHACRFKIFRSYCTQAECSDHLLQNDVKIFFRADRIDVFDNIGIIELLHQFNFSFGRLKNYIGESD